MGADVSHHAPILILFVKMLVLRQIRVVQVKGQWVGKLVGKLLKRRRPVRLRVICVKLHKSAPDALISQHAAHGRDVKIIARGIALQCQHRVSNSKASHSGNGLSGIETPQMILLVLRIRQMRSTYTANFLHHGGIFTRRISEKGPVSASPTVDDVVNRSRAQIKVRLYVPMRHLCFQIKQQTAILYHNHADDAQVGLGGVGWL